MTYLPKIVAILLVIDAVVILFKPALLRKYCQIFSQGSMIYLAAIIKAFVGGAFLFGVSGQCNLPPVITAFGILAVAGAVFIFALPAKAKGMALFFATKNNAIMRIIGVIYLTIAILLVHAS